MEQRSDIKRNEIIRIIEYGSGDNIFIFSPAFPFSHKIMLKFLDIGIPDSKFVFSDLNPSKNVKASSYTLENFLDFYLSYIKEIKQDSKIYLIGFGIFSIIFSKLIFFLKERVTFLFFLEPDFSNSLLAKIFDSENIPFMKYNFLVNFYMDNNREKNTNIFKKNLKYLKHFYYNIKRHLQSNKVLRDTIDFKNVIKIYWKTMARDSWPLPQVLVEEYEFQALLLEKNILDNLSDTGGILFEDIKNVCLGQKNVDKT